VASTGRTVLFVSHNMAAVRRLCNSGLMLKSGVLISHGSIQTALNAYSESATTVSGDFNDAFGRTTITIQEAELFVNGVRADSLASGETAEIRLRVQFNELVQGPLRVGFALENTSGVYAMINYSHFQAAALEPKSGTISAIIERTPFAEGLYRLHLRILSGSNEIYWNTGLRTIRVDAGDFFGTGIRGEESLCPWLHKLEWRQL
jgi:lipopolysaccharide transport system ATP-binding protein